MRTSFKDIDEIFEFKGLWEVDSKCGLKISKHNGKYVIIATELYLDNPGTSITQATCSLAKQICEKYNLSKTEIVYLEHTPDMNSKLSFYDENFYLVEFEIKEDSFVNPKWKQICNKTFDDFLNSL